VWNAFGGYDYTMSELGDPEYFRSMGMGQAELDWMAALPAWSVAAWAVGVWGSVLGSLLLLARSRHAATAFAASFVGAAISFAYQFSSGRPPSMIGTLATVIPVVILLAIVAQWLYARRMATAGVLR
jgi:hypothetical protein